MRPGRGVDPQQDSRPRNSTTSSTTSVCPTAPSTRMHCTSGIVGAGDGDIMVIAERGPSPHGQLCARPAQRAAARVSRDDVLLPARRHHHPDSQLRSAGADRRSDCKATMSRQARSRRPQMLDGSAPGSGPGRSPHPAAVRLSHARRRRGSDQGPQGGYTERDVATSMLNTLSGSFQITPMFFLN